MFNTSYSCVASYIDDHYGSTMKHALYAHCSRLSQLFKDQANETIRKENVCLVLCASTKTWLHFI